MLGNHDWSYHDDYHTEDSIERDRPLFRQFCGGDEDFHVTSIGELTFVSLDNTAEVYWPGTEERLKEVLNKYDNVIILQHIPLYNDTLHEGLLDGVLPQYITGISSYGEVTLFEISGNEKLLILQLIILFLLELQKSNFDY